MYIRWYALYRSYSVGYVFSFSVLFVFCRAGYDNPVMTNYYLLLSTATLYTTKRMKNKLQLIDECNHKK